MIGYRSVQHQGFAAARAGRQDEANPYPHGCQAFYEYRDGCNAYRAGCIIDRRGNVADASDTMARVRLANEQNFRHGAGY